MTDTIVQGVVLPWVRAFSDALLPILAVAAAAWVRQWLIARGHRTDVLDALTRGAADGYGDLVRKGGKITDPGAAKEIIAAGVQYGLDMVPAKMAAIALDPDGAARIVKAELGKLLAVDPTVTVGAGSTATASAGPGETAQATAGNPA